jgi:hypothetical protein
MLLTNGAFQGTVLGYNIGKTPLEIEIIGKGKGSSVGFNFREKTLIVFCRRMGRYCWALRR